MRRCGTDRTTLTAAVEQALRAPSVHNTQPWRWRIDGAVVELFADPDRRLVATDPDAAGTGPVHRHELWPASEGRRPDLLDEPVPLGRRDPFGPSPSGWPSLHPGVHPDTSHLPDPEVAEPLAALLDVLARHLEHDETVDPQIRMTAVRLARYVLRCYPVPDSTAEENPR